MKLSSKVKTEKITCRTMKKRSVPTPFGDLTIEQLKLLKKKVKKKGFPAKLGLAALITILLEALERYRNYQEELILAEIQRQEELVSGYVYMR